MKKAQAAIEYLMVHGWAILVLLVIISTLYSLGVLNPGSYTSEECVFLPGFDCKFHLLQKTSAGYLLKIIATNGLGFDITIDEANLTAEGLGSVKSKSYIATVTPSTGTVIKQGEEITMTFNIPFDASSPAVPEIGEAKGVKVRIKYRNCSVASQPNCSDGTEHIISGRVVARIEPG